MELHTFTTDEVTGYLDIPEGVAVCEGDCGEAYMERALKSYCGRDYCEACHPKCCVDGCEAKAVDETDGSCMKCWEEAE